MVDTLFHMGFNCTVVLIYYNVQVNEIINERMALILWECVSLLRKKYLFSTYSFSNIWPTVPVAAVFTGMDQIIFSSPVFWLGLILIPVAALLFDVTAKV